MWWWYFLLLLTGGVASVTGFSNGRVSVACADMVPQHGYEPRTDLPPYIISVDKRTFSPDDNITLSLKVASSNIPFFRGFLIEARDAGKLDSPSVGSFTLTDPDESQLLQCDHAQASAVSHTSSSKKTQVQVVWESPKNPPQKVQFLVTLVHQYKVYWVRAAGPVVSLRGTTAAPHETTAPTWTSSPAALSAPFSSVGCGLSKSCLRDPPGCLPQSHPRCFFLSFSVDAADTSVMFELSGPADGYVSFAVSLDQWMGDDEVYMCVNNGGGVSISTGYAYGRTAPQQETQTSLWGRVWRLADGIIQCRFHRNMTVPEVDRFNFNHSFFLFVAHGQSHQGFILKHQLHPLVSTRPVLIRGRPQDMGGSRSPMLLKFHGVLMLTAWMWTVSTAVVIARHFRDATVFGRRLWFQIHRTMMVLVLVLTGPAFILPFIYRGGWSKPAGSHPYVGCAVVVLSVVQVTVALLRPAPESTWRVAFNWIHFGTGTSAQILAAVCVFLGAAQQGALLPRPWAPVVLSGWTLWIGLTDLFLWVQSYKRRRRGNTRSPDEAALLFPHKHTEVCGVRTVALLVFVTGNTGFLTAFIQTISTL